MGVHMNDDKKQKLKYVKTLYIESWLLHEITLKGVSMGLHR